MSKKTKFLVPLSIVIVLLYVILAAIPLQKELRFIPVWTIDAEQREQVSDGKASADQGQAASESDSQDFSSLIPFRLGQTIGYFSTDGKVSHGITFPYKATISQNSYAIYGTSAEGTDFFNPSGKKIGSIAPAGFPYFTKDRNYLFYPGGSSFTTLTEDGKPDWKYEGFTPITAFASSENGCAVGFANGTVVSFDKSGDISQMYKPGGSRYEVIFGLALSSSSDYIATVSGLESQRFVIAKRTSTNTNAQPSIIFYKTLKNEVSRQVLVKFTKNEERVFFDSGDGLGIINCNDFCSSQLPINGEVLSIVESEDGKVVFILSKSGKTYTVSAIQSFDVFAGSFSFEADSAFIATKGSSLFIGRDSEISRIDIALR